MNLKTFPDSQPVVFGVTRVLFAVTTFCLSLATVSLAGGWHELFKRFRLNNPFDGITEGMQSGRMRFFGNYKNSLRLGADAEGLHLSVPALFRFMHPPFVCALEGDRDLSAKEVAIRRVRDVNAGE